MRPKKTIKQFNKSQFFEKINKIDKPLARFIKETKGPNKKKSQLKKEKLQQIPQKYKG